MVARGNSLETPTPAELDEVISLLVQFSPRWKKIAFWFDNYFPRPLLNIDVSSFLRLESAFLMWDFIPQQLGDVWSILYQSPLIHEVRWEYYPPRWHLVPWGQMTSVNCHGFIAPGMFWDLFASCPYLETLEIGIAQGENDVTPALPVLPRITHKNIRQLVLHFKTSATPFYDSLIFPALTSLHVVHHYLSSTSDDAEEALSDMIEESGCALRTFKMEGCQLSEERLLELLQLPELQTLTFLRLTYVTESILSLLSEATTQEDRTNTSWVGQFKIMPELEAFVADRGCMTHGTALSEMLLSRLPLLKCFHIMTLGSSKFDLSDDVVCHDKIRYTPGRCGPGTWHIVESQHFGLPEGPSRLNFPLTPFFGHVS